MNMYLVDVRKIKNYQIKEQIKKESNKLRKFDFFGYINEPSNHQKKKVFDDKNFYPILIINPIFQSINYNNNNFESNNDYDSSLIDNKNYSSKININSINRSVDSLDFNEINSQTINLHQNLNEKFRLGFIE